MPDYSEKESLIFWDSSAIVPLLINEGSSESVLNFYKQHPLMIVWWFSEVECTSALARLERENRMNTGHMAAALNRLKSLKEHWHEILTNDIIRETAKRMLRVHRLRTADALQLAALDYLSDRKTREVIFACLDTRLVEAAQKEGFISVL